MGGAAGMTIDVNGLWQSSGAVWRQFGLNVRIPEIRCGRYSEALRGAGVDAYGIDGRYRFWLNN